MTRARLELALAVLLAAAAAATTVWPTWLESLTGLEPDGGSGATEWWLVGVLALAAVASLALSARDHRAHRLAHR